MLLSPLGSPSKYQASLCLSLPPLQHHHIPDEDEYDVEEEDEDDDSSSTASDSDSSSAVSDESSNSSASGGDVDVDLHLDIYHVDAGVSTILGKQLRLLSPDVKVGVGLSAEVGIEAEPLTSPAPLSEPDPLALPVELIFTIVELASSHKRTALSLCRVSSWVRSAVLPILYGTLVIHGAGPNPLDLIAASPASNSGDGDSDGGAGAYGYNEARGWCGVSTPSANSNSSERTETRTLRRKLESPLRYVRSLWLDVPPERAPPSLDACPRLRQLALPLEAHATICNTTRWLAQDSGSAFRSTKIKASMNRSSENALELDIDCHDADFDAFDDDYEDDARSEIVEPCRSFTVLGQSHPHRWAPLTSSPNGRAFLRGVTHLRILNLCLSHYIPLEYTPNLTHLCIPFFDLRISPSSLTFTDPSSSPTTSSTGSAASSSFTGLDYILAHPPLQMVVLTLNPRYWRFDELSLKGWAVRAMARDPRLYVVAATRDDATRDWDVPRRDWEDEAHAGVSVWDKAICVRRKFLTRLSRTWESYLS